MATERTVLVRLKANASDFVRGMGTAAAAVKGLRSEIDTTSDRTAWLAQSILALGPTLVPLGAAAVPVFAGLATQMTMTGVAAGTLGLAFNGVGKALKALNQYQIDPTDAHLKALQESMAKIGPEGADFVKFLDSLGPQLTHLQEIARGGGLFPGIENGIKHLLTLLPQVGRIVGETSDALGQLASGAGKGLSGPRFAEFFNFLETDAKPILIEMGHTVGNFVDGLAAMLVAFAPLSRGFSSGLEDMSKSFADWAHGLDSSTGFQDFVDYIRESGPKAMDLLGAMADAIISILQAAAPIGDVMLPVLTDFLNIISKIADTPLGTVFLSAAAAASLYGRAVALAEVTTGGMFRKLTPGLTTMNEQWRTTPIPTIRQFATAVGSVTKSHAELEKSSTGVNRVLKRQAQTTMQARTVVGGFARSMAPTAAAVGLLGVSLSGLDKKMGLTNTTSLALMGLMIGPWGAAIGAGAGAVLDLRHANDELENSIKGVYLAAKSGDFTAMEENVRNLKKQIDDMTHTRGVGDFFGDTFSKIGDALNHPLDIHPGDERVARAKAAVADAAVAEAAHRAAVQNELLARGFQASAAGADTAAQSAIDFRNSLEKLNATLSGRASMRDYEASIDDFTKTLTKNGKTLDINTDKGRQNQAALDAIAQTALKVADSLSGADRVGFLDAARHQFIKAAEAAGMTRAQARGLANEVLGLDNVKGTPKIILDPGGSFHILNDIQQRLNQFKDKTIRVTVLQNYVQAGKNRAQVADAQAHADGGTISGPRYPYRDQVPALLAPTEEVISNRYGQADRWRPLLKAINDNKLANGGTAGVTAPLVIHAPGSAAVAGSTIDYNRLAAAVMGNRLLEHRDTRDAFLWALRTAFSETPVTRGSADSSLMAGLG